MNLWNALWKFHLFRCHIRLVLPYSTNFSIGQIGHVWVLCVLKSLAHPQISFGDFVWFHWNDRFSYSISWWKIMLIFNEQFSESFPAMAFLPNWFLLYQWKVCRTKKENNVFPMGIVAYHPMTQLGPQDDECLGLGSRIDNPCIETECQGMCILSRNPDEDSIGYRCVCPIGQVLLSLLLFHWYHCWKSKAYLSFCKFVSAE